MTSPSSLLARTSPALPLDSLDHKPHSLVSVVGEKGLQLAGGEIGVVGALCFPAFPVFLIQLVDL